MKDPFNYKNIWIINLFILGIEPLIVMAVLFLKIAPIDETPWWMRGIVLSWAATINLWIGLGTVMKHPLPGIGSIKFTLSNFIFPVLTAFFYIDNFWLSVYQITSFHFLSLGIGIFCIMFFGPMLKAKNHNENPLKIKYRFQKPELSVSIFHTTGIIIFASLLFGSWITLPAIGCEYLFLKNLNILMTFDLKMLIDNYWLILRYGFICYQSYILFKIMIVESIFT